MREPFIGRDRECTELLAGFEDAAGGRGGLYLIAGEPGIGKTALADHVASRAAEGGARVLWSRSWEGPTAPYWMWAQVIRALVNGADAATLGALCSPDTAHITLLAPELADHFGDAGRSVRAPDSDAGRFYLFQATARFLGKAAAIQPLVVVLDDLLAGDRASLLLLGYLARELPASRLLVVGTYRDDEAARSPEAVELLGDLVRDGRLLRLRGLDRQEVGRLIARLAEVEPAPNKVTAIHEATTGNPLFVREVTRLLAAEDALDRPGRPTIPVPDSVRTVIRRRLAALSAEAIQVLSAAAVVGREFDVRLVGAAADLPAKALLVRLSEAAALGVVVEVPDSVGLYRFSHPLMREAIYEGLPILARMQTHRLVGQAIERVGPEAESRVGELAYHFSQSATTGDVAKAAAYARRAGEQAMEVCAYEEAALHYRRAIEALQLTGVGETMRCELYLGLGRAQARAGDYLSARDSFLEAATTARSIQAPELLARAALGFGEPHVEGGVVDHRLLALLQEALDALGPDDSALRARALARFSLELTFSDDHARRESLSRAALDMARRLGDVGGLAIACRARWMAAWGPDGLEERRALSDEIVGLASATGDRETELLGRARRITCSMEAGRIKAAWIDAAAHARLAGELRMPYHEWTAATLRAGRALLQGSMQEAERLAESASAVLAGRPNAAHARLNQLTAVRWEQGRLDALRQAWQEGVEQLPEAAYARGWLALADAETGRDDEAAAGLRALIEELPEAPRGGLWLAALATAALVAARLEDGDAAARLYPLLLPYEGRAIVIPMPHPVVCLGSARLYLGLLGGGMSRWQEAAEHFEAAIRVNGRLGARPLLARTRYEYARLLIRRGRSGDRTRALALADRAEATALASGMTVLAEGCRRLRHLATGAAVTSERAPLTATPGAAGRNVFRRQGEYWTVEYEGSLVRLRDSKGLRHLARLLAEPGREFHALDLEAADTARAPSRHAVTNRAKAGELEARADLGDAGELLDAQAKAAYRARLEELRSELAEADSWGDPARAEKATREMEALAAELARAVGLGGRDRRAASHAERARLNATRAIRTAIDNLARASPELGRHLSSTIRTGRYCSYSPDPRVPITWECSFNGAD